MTSQVPVWVANEALKDMSRDDEPRLTVKFQISLQNPKILSKKKHFCGKKFTREFERVKIGLLYE